MSQISFRMPSTRGKRKKTRWEGATREIGALAENLGFAPIKLGGLR